MKNNRGFLTSIVLAISTGGLLSVAAPPDVSGYSAHEWGTFTSVQGTDGVPIAWNPFVTADLPAFVYSRKRPVPESLRSRHPAAFEALGSKDGHSWLQRMETPVIYFHADHPVTVRVRVAFPRGLLTEWYPGVTAFGPAYGVDALFPETRENFLEWSAVQVVPASDRPSPPLLEEPNPSHYYAARAVRSGNVSVPATGSDGSPAETERFLFYRGAGNFETPLRVSMPAPRDLIVRNTGRQPLRGLHVIETRAKHTRHLAVSDLAAGASTTVSLPDPAADAADAADADTRGSLVTALERDLAAAGLHPDEASAMVATWRDSWLGEEGLRVLYLLPRDWTDATLPLTLSPAPERLVRVMVGRAEVFTPADERAARSGFARYRNGRKATDLTESFDPIQPRFREPLLIRVGQIEQEWRRRELLFSCTLPMPDGSSEKSLKEDLDAAHLALVGRLPESRPTHPETAFLEGLRSIAPLSLTFPTGDSRPPGQLPRLQALPPE